MAYTPTTWQSGDVISAEKMNKIEQGIANSGSGALVVTATTGEVTTTLDKTWQEIYDAFPNVYVAYSGQTVKWPVSGVGSENGIYFVYSENADYTVSSATGYPSVIGDK